MDTAEAEGRDNQRAVLGIKRLRAGLAIVLVLLVVLGGRLFHIQGLDPAGMAQAAVNKRLVNVTVPPLRGDILDANGNVLARSVQRFDVVVDQRLSQGIEEYTRRDPETGDIVKVSMDQGLAELAEVLGQTPEETEAAVLGDKPFNFVAKSVTPELKDKALEIKVPGVYADETTLRTYPSGAVAGSIVGFLGSDNEPLEGLELVQNEHLKGTPGTKTFEIGGDGARIPYATNEETPAVNGQSVRLTIDQDLQWFAQQTIAEKVEETGAEWGNIVVVEAKTGRIAAMAESTTPDPNNPGATPAEFRKPLSVTTSYEPGSSTKMITMAAAIEEGIIEPTTRIEVPPTYTVDGQTFSDAFSHGTEQRSAAGIFARSMNTGTVMIGQQLTPQQRYDWLRKFGIGEKTEIGLNGETAGILAPPDQWDIRQQYTVLFGQGLAQTSLHTAMAYQVIANNGIRLKPQLIDSYIDPDGTEHPVEQSEGIEVVSEDTARKVQGLLETTVAEGSGKYGALTDYRVGAKTSTAEAPGPNGGFDGFTIQFAGAAPMDDPQYVVVVTLQRPPNALQTLAHADAFKAVMEHALRSKNVKPSTGEPVVYPVMY